MVQSYISMTDPLLTAQFTPCGKVKKNRDKHDDSFIFVLIDGIYVPFRVNSPKLNDYVGYDQFVLADEQEQPDEFIGFTVIDTEQGLLGTVAALDTSTANTLVELDDGRLLPLHENFVESVDDEARILTLTLPFRL